jgi:transposase
VAIRPRNGSAAVCSRWHSPAPGYDQPSERRFEFIPLWGFLVFLLYTMRRVDCRRCGCRKKFPGATTAKRTLTKAHLPGTRTGSLSLTWQAA